MYEMRRKRYERSMAEGMVKQSNSIIDVIVVKSYALMKSQLPPMSKIVAAMYQPK